MAPRSQPATGFKPPRRPRRNGGGRGVAGTRDRGGGPGEAPVAELKLPRSTGGPPSARAVARPRAPPLGRAWRSDTSRTGGRRSRRGPWKPVFRSLRPHPGGGYAPRAEGERRARGGRGPSDAPSPKPTAESGSGGTVGWRLGLTVNDPSGGSPTETLLRLLLPLDSQV